MSQKKLYRVFTCYYDSDFKCDLGYYLSSEDPKNILIKSVIVTKTKELFRDRNVLLQFVKKYIEIHNDKTEKELVDAIEKKGILYLCKLYCDVFDKEIVIRHIDFAECNYAIEDPDAPSGSNGRGYDGGSYYAITELKDCDTDALKLIDDNINQHVKITDSTLEKK